MNGLDFPFIIEEIKIVDYEQVIVGRRFLDVSPYFEEPLDSTNIDIIHVAKLSPTIETVPVNKINFKYCRLPADNNTWLLVS